MSSTLLIDQLARRGTDFALLRGRRIGLGMVTSTLRLVALVLLPSVWPQQFSMLQGVSIDNDPENMLAEDEPVRRFHDQGKHGQAG